MQEKPFSPLLKQVILTLVLPDLDKIILSPPSSLIGIDPGLVRLLADIGTGGGSERHCRRWSGWFLEGDLRGWGWWVWGWEGEWGLSCCCWERKWAVFGWQFGGWIDDGWMNGWWIGWDFGGNREQPYSQNDFEFVFFSSNFPILLSHSVFVLLFSNPIEEFLSFFRKDRNFKLNYQFKPLWIAI